MYLSLLPASLRTAKASPWRWLPVSLALIALAGCGGSSGSDENGRAVEKVVYVKTNQSTFAGEDSTPMDSTEMYLSNSDGSGKTRVADTGETVYYYAPKLSQDGSKIVVLSSRGNCGDVCTVNAQGIPTPLQVWVMNADGSEAKPLTRITDAGRYAQPAQYPALSRDGSQAVYSDRTGITLTNTSNLERKTFGGEPYNYPYSSPAFSPDGTKIAYSYDGIYTMNTDGTGKTKIVEQGSAPSFSPDGSKITYIGYPSDPLATRSQGLSQPSSWVYIANSDGTEQKRLTYGSGVSYSPSFSKDGKSIIYKLRGNSVDAAQATVVTINLDGSNQASVAIDGI